MIWISESEQLTSLRVEGRECVVRNVRADVVHELEIEPEVVRREQLPAKWLSALDQVVQVGT